METYRHTQTGRKLIVVVLVIAVLAGSIAGRGQAPPWVPAFVIAIVLASVFVFSSITVTVDQHALEFWFGPGVVKKRHDLADVAEVTAVRNPWWYGFGIHYTPRGWLYNVAGPDAVEVRLVSGRTFRLGTDEPSRLVEAIRRAKASRG